MTEQNTVELAKYRGSVMEGKPEESALQDKPVADRLMTVMELADYLQVAKTWIYWRTRQKGKDTIPMVRLGKYRRFRLPDVMAWLEKQSQAAASKKQKRRMSYTGHKVTKPLIR